MNKTFVGFGFGPIQSALFLYEAHRSGNFARFVVAEIDQSAVKAARDNGGCYTVNIARKGMTDQARVEGVELYNPRDPEGRKAIVEAVAQADEMATALPSVSFYDLGGDDSVVRMLADGLALRKAALPTIIYTAENNNHAAEILTEKLQGAVAGDALKQVQCLNTVIGKMSGVITDPAAISALRLRTLTPYTPRAVLVEEFNRILISRINLPGFRRGIEVFVEKDDLLPFEEAKLYGHNAIHALMGYLADVRELETMAQVSEHPDILETARRAFLEESGAALIRRYASLKDPLFTARGYREYAEDLLERMIRPNLNDLVVRITRDHVRKLGWEDRLFGTMRLALQYGIEPVHMARGAAAALVSLVNRQGELKDAVSGLPTSREGLDAASVEKTLRGIWGAKADETAAKLISLTLAALPSV